MNPQHDPHAHHHARHPQEEAPSTVDLAALYAAQSGPTPPAAQGESREIRVRLEARETEWEIAPGRTVSAWGYEGSVPGPTIVARVGDVLVAHLVNSLPEPTVVHWHGLRLASRMDGNDTVQTPVGPGESFEYRFVLPDAGTFWYHSHSNETVQIERGLYGALVVLGPDEPVFDAERVLVLDDVKLDRKGRIAGTALFDRHSGREGEVTLINGRNQPEIEIASFADPHRVAPLSAKQRETRAALGMGHVARRDKGTVAREPPERAPDRRSPGHVRAHPTDANRSAGRPHDVPRP
jgi:FtsP/CotA-like multicopper oxidase with cupredoxin domain